MNRYHITLPPLFLALTAPVFARIDLDDQLSDLWQLRYSGEGLADSDDPDADGANTLQEEAAGNDPFYFTSRHQIEALSITESEVILSWTA